MWTPDGIFSVLRRRSRLRLHEVCAVENRENAHELEICAQSKLLSRQIDDSATWGGRVHCADQFLHTVQVPSSNEYVPKLCYNNMIIQTQGNVVDRFPHIWGFEIDVSTDEILRPVNGSKKSLELFHIAVYYYREGNIECFLLWTRGLLDVTYSRNQIWIRLWRIFNNWDISFMIFSISLFLSILNTYGVSYFSISQFLSRAVASGGRGQCPPPTSPP